MSQIQPFPEMPQPPPIKDSGNPGRFNTLIERFIIALYAFVTQLNTDFITKLNALIPKINAVPGQVSSAQQAATTASNAATSATQSKNAAATSATNAANSATASATSATNSASSATAANSSKNAAAASATAAATSATNASASATAADGSKSAAAASATAAATSATNSASSATSANTSKNAAASSATAAATSATNAANSATASATSATNSANSATAAANSATAAKASADAALAAEENLTGGATYEAIANRLAKRDAAGRAQFADPVAPLDAVNKRYAEAIAAGAMTGNAATASRLQTARKINDVLFDGSKDIVLPGPLKAWYKWPGPDFYPVSDMVFSSYNIVSFTRASSTQFNIQFPDGLFRDFQHIYISCCAITIAGTGSSRAYWATGTPTMSFQLRPLDLSPIDPSKVLISTYGQADDPPHICLFFEVTT